jgi:hypothetical protein
LLAFGGRNKLLAVIRKVCCATEPDLMGLRTNERKKERKLSQKSRDKGRNERKKERKPSQKSRDKGRKQERKKERKPSQKSHDDGLWL